MQSLNFFLFLVFGLADYSFFKVGKKGKMDHLIRKLLIASVIVKFS
jgi:hypothetical protein